MVKAIYNNKVIAESNSFEMVEGNVYFPKESIKKEFFKESNHHTYCHWKGQASYYHVTVDGKENKDSAWYYPDPKEAALNIKDHVAFWHGIEVVKD